MEKKLALVKKNPTPTPKSSSIHSDDKNLDVFSEPKRGNYIFGHLPFKDVSSYKYDAMTAKNGCSL